ncbi:PD-(D/E)XK motif protein [Ruania alba]|uniref:Putative PD-(D/E)XK family member n=1 Tax=Ruania alba TaxID=648782 RepID=A0A1H5MHS6_9MICO|nr:PD-(D/E)XK motif protein [Ruania alba]SEE88743.1 Putative PD-(D/E)XK family member [Ruania alba]
MSISPTFESLRILLTSATPANGRHRRRIKWIGPDQSLAIARNQQNELELFILGPQLVALDQNVRERLVHDTWRGERGETFAANRLWLPAGDHFDAAAATVLIELLDHGRTHNMAGAFRRTEPLIALVLDEAAAENAALTGLAGELLVLLALMRAPTAPPSQALLACWLGSDRSSRDFQLGSVGVEVKTSTTSSSRHHIEGWYQVEPGVAADGSVESELYLLSLGIRWLQTSSEGHSIESLIQTIQEFLPQSLRLDLIRCVRDYGDRNFQIDDQGKVGQTALRRPFDTTFERLYDIADDRIRIPRSSDLSSFQELVHDSVKFQIQLPERVRGDRNPVVGLPSIVAAILNQASA